MNSKTTAFSHGLSLIFCLVLASCSTPGKNVRFKQNIKVTSGEEGPARPSARELSAPIDTPVLKASKRVEYIDGTGVFSSEVKTRNSLITKDQKGDVSLTFKNTDIRIVIKAVLTDTLKLSYAIDSQVEGNITLETSGAISPDALRLTLEAVLRTKGYALVETTTGLQVLPVTEAPRNVRTIRRGRPASSDLPGFAVQVVPLKYTVPSEMEKLIEPFSPSDGILLSDDQRQLLVIAGTSQELSGMMRAIETFDINTMAGKSFAIFSLNYVDPEQIVKELEELFGKGNQNEGGNVQFIPVQRINKMIAVSPNKEILRTVESWIEKLDLGDSAPGRRIYVYQVKNSRAVDIAETLNTILGSRYGNAGFSNGNSESNANTRNRQSSGNGTISNNSGALGSSNSGGYGEEGIRIVPSEENNSLLIMGTPSEFAVVETALKQIDIPPRQVLIEMMLAEVGLTEELRYGLQWQFDFDNNSVAFGKSASPAAQFPGFSWKHVGNNASAVLNAIESMTDVKVVSSPKILVLNNQSATLQIGDEVPIPTSTATSTSNANAPIVNSIQYRNTGVILTVTPRINDGGLVMLDVEQELSDVAETSSSGIDAPTIKQRKLKSSIAVQNGSTIALGGLIRTTTSDVNSGVPILRSIPLLGKAFSSTSLIERRTELVILLTPRIIRNVEETRQVMEYLREEFRSLMGEQEDNTIPEKNLNVKQNKTDQLH